MKQIRLAVLFTLALATGLVAEEPKELAVAKKEFAQIPHPDEAAREHYVLSLLALREKAVHSNGDWKAVDTELKKHPAPKDADSKALTAYRLGRWDSSRHQLLFNKNGTWSMWPVEPDVTRGAWKIAGNQFLYSPGDPPPSTKYTIIVLTAKKFVYTDGDMVFIENKAK
ncbi:MAG: hypothetical protein WDN28_20230 [Chthoniobacter sp.]